MPGATRLRYDIVDRQLDDLQRSSSRFVLSTTLWSQYSVPLSLQWKTVEFNRGNSLNVPNNSAGVYLFSVRVGVKGIPGEYLIYVGKTDRNFRTRFKEYLIEQDSLTGRFVVTTALSRWRGFLWFYYAPVNDYTRIKECEDALISALIPPLNTQFPASISQAVNAWRRQ